MFDNFPAYLRRKPIISSLKVPSTHEHFVTSPVKPDTPKSFFQCLKSPMRRIWIAAAKQAFTKNKNVAAFSLPFPKSELPKDARVFRTLLVPEWKETELRNVWEARLRECVVGTPQVQYVDFLSSYSASVDSATVKVQITYAAANNQMLFILDIKNAFQNTFANPGFEMYVTTPPCYMEWLFEEEGFRSDKNETYYRMMFNSVQGTKDAGNNWNRLLASLFKDYKLFPSKVDHGFFWKNLDNKQMMFVSLATDDCLVSVPNYKYADDFIRFMKQYFKVSIQKGPILKFLGIRIVQTDHAVSLDQSEYVFEALRKYFGTDFDKIKTISTPMRYDNGYETEIFESTPLTPSELKEYALLYKGTYRYHTGTFGHASNITRWDIKYAVQRLAEYNNAPTDLAFKGIARLYRYLAGDPHRPLTFPRASFNGKSKLSYMVTPTDSVEFFIPNAPTNFNDAELARCLNTRTTYYCTMICVLGVIIQMKVKKSASVMTHTTDAEMRANFEGCRHLIPIRTLYNEMGCNIHTPSMLFCDNKAVVDIIESERMTPRCRHIDIPIAFLHYHK